MLYLFPLPVEDRFKSGEKAGWKPALPGNPIRGEKCPLGKGQLNWSNSETE